MLFDYKFNMNIAGICMSVGCRYRRVMEMCREYITEAGTPVFEVSVPGKDISEVLSEKNTEAEPWYIEFSLLYRCVMRKLIYYGVFAFHGAAISYRCRKIGAGTEKKYKTEGDMQNETAFVFTAPSGTGKSTHIKLWKKYLGDSVDIINGDKPVIKVSENGILVCSTPWAGKEGWHKNRSVRLGGICILTRTRSPDDDENSVKMISPGDYLSVLLNQIFLPADDPQGCAAVLELFDRVFKSEIPFYLLSCGVSEAAVRASFAALTGTQYPEKQNRKE